MAEEEYDSGSDGEWLGEYDDQGRMHGRGVYKFDSGDTYVGDYFEDQMHGQGKYTWADGSSYEGGYRNGMYHGYGVLTLPGEEVYKGQWVDDERHGHGVSESGEGVYDGEWAHDKRHGKGTLTCGGLVVYDGEWKDDVKCGMGKSQTIGPDGKLVTLEGEWKNGFLNGRGVWKMGTDQTYDGEFVNSKFHGHGVFTRHTPEGTVEWSFIGEFADGFRHGKGCERSAEGTRTGDWYYDQPSTNVESHRIVDQLAEKMKELVKIEAPVRNNVDLEAVPSLSNAPDVFTDEDFIGWQAVRLLGRGSFGAAYEAVLNNGRTVCVKIIELGSITDPEGIAKLHNEIDLMKRLNHPNIVQYFGSVEDKEKKTLNIFMEFVDGGSLTSYAKKIKACGALSESTIRDWSYQMICGVKYLHDSNVVHRDIKGDNILVSVNQGILKLADFGCSKSIDDICSKTHGCKTMVGTPYWMAPEVITCANDSEGYGPKSDIWSVGCTIVEIITGKPAWPECNSMWAAIYKIANSKGLPPFFQEKHANTSPEFLKFLERMFERSPPKRASAKELLEDPFVSCCRK